MFTRIFWAIAITATFAHGIAYADATIGETLEYDESAHKITKIRMSHWFDGYREGILSMLGIGVAYNGPGDDEDEFQSVIDCLYKEEPMDTYARLLEDAQDRPQMRLRDWAIEEVLWNCKDEIAEVLAKMQDSSNE